MGSGHCGMGNPRGAVYLIAIVDIILSLILLLLSIVALGDLKKVSGLLDRDSSFEFNEQLLGDNRNDIVDEAGRHENDSLHGSIVLFLVNTLVTLILSVGLFFGVQKELDCPIKSWLIYGCTIVLLFVISLLVITAATGQAVYLLLLLLVIIRVYEIWVVFDFLKRSRFSFNPTLLSRSGSTERLHNV